MDFTAPLLVFATGLVAVGVLTLRDLVRIRRLKRDVEARFAQRDELTAALLDQLGPLSADELRSVYRLVVTNVAVRGSLDASVLHVVVSDARRTSALAAQSSSPQ